MEMKRSSTRNPAYPAAAAACRLALPPPLRRRNVLRLLYLGIAALAMGYVEVSCCTISGEPH